MECTEMAERLTDLLEGDLEPEVEVAALDHLATCSSCETVLSETQDVMGLARSHGRTMMSDDMRSKLWSRVVGDVDDSAGS